MSAKVTFRITSYYKRPRGEAGLTQVSTRRMDIGDALGWVLGELPDGTWDMTHEGSDGDGAQATTIVIRWADVPAEIKDGLS